MAPAAGNNNNDAPSSRNNSESGGGGDRSLDRNDSSETNGGYHHVGNNLAPNHMGRRHQLYIGNLTWVIGFGNVLEKDRNNTLLNFQWTTDQDIANAITDVGINDFQEVKFFENRANGQSKGFCAVSLGSEPSMRMCMDRLPKQVLHGQTPVVTLPTKQALNQFESQQKTRPNPPPTNGPRGSGGPPQGMGGGGQVSNMPMQMGGGGGHQNRMMNPNNGPPPQHMRGGPHMQQSGGPNMSQGGQPGPGQRMQVGIVCLLSKAEFELKE